MAPVVNDQRKLVLGSLERLLKTTTTHPVPQVRVHGEAKLSSENKGMKPAQSLGSCKVRDLQHSQEKTDPHQTSGLTRHHPSEGRWSKVSEMRFVSGKGPAAMLAAPELALAGVLRRRSPLEGGGGQERVPLGADPWESCSQAAGLARCVQFVLLSRGAR